MIEFAHLYSASSVFHLWLPITESFIGWLPSNHMKCTDIRHTLTLHWTITLIPFSAAAARSAASNFSLCSKLLVLLSLMMFIFHACVCWGGLVLRAESVLLLRLCESSWLCEGSSAKSYCKTVNEKTTTKKLILKRLAFSSDMRPWLLTCGWLYVS